MLSISIIILVPVHAVLKLSGSEVSIIHQLHNTQKICCQTESKPYIFYSGRCSLLLLEFKCLYYGLSHGYVVNKIIFDVQYWNNFKGIPA